MDFVVVSNRYNERLTQFLSALASANETYRAHKIVDTLRAGRKYGVDVILSQVIIEDVPDSRIPNPERITNRTVVVRQTKGAARMTK